MTIILFFVTLIFTFLPWVLKSSNSPKWRTSVLSLCTCLAGGVIVGSLFFHLIPETLINVHSVSIAPAHGKSNPIAHDCRLHDHSLGCSHHQGAESHSHSVHDHADDCCEEPFQWGSLVFGLSFFGLLAIDRLLLAHRNCAEPSSSPIKEKLKSSPSSAHKVCCSSKNDNHSHHAPSSVQSQAGFGEPLKSTPNQPSSSQECHSVNAFGGCHVEGLEQGSSKVQSLFFVLALSVHSFVEGLAVQSISTAPAMFSFCISLFSHKCLEALALGISVYKAKFSISHSIILGFIYSCLTPLGILISIGLQETSISGPVLAAVVNGLAAGSFLFVAVIEMIIPELHTYSSSTPAKFLVLICGFLGMAAVSLFPHAHTH